MGMVPSAWCLLFMHAQVLMVPCTLLHGTKIITNIILPTERPHCRSMLFVRHIQKDLKPEIILL